MFEPRLFLCFMLRERVRNWEGELFISSRRHAQVWPVGSVHLNIDSNT